MKRSSKQSTIFDFCRKKSCDDKPETNLTESVTDLDRLTEHAAKQNLTIVSTPADGDCMFSALAEQLEFPGSAAALRREITSYLHLLPEFVSHMDFRKSGKQSFQHYVDNMSKDGVWGDGIVLEAAVEIFQRPIKILQADGTEIIITSPDISDDARSVRLGYLSHSGCGTANHYVSLRETADAQFSDSESVTESEEVAEPTVSEATEEAMSSDAGPGCDLPVDDQQSQSSELPKEAASETSRSSLDIGNYVACELNPIPDALKLKLLEQGSDHLKDYKFKSDVPSESKRQFRYDWLAQYSPWLSYSESMKGAFCRYCILFRQKAARGFQGAFITTPFIKYKDFHVAAKNHAKSGWHRASSEDAINFQSTSHTTASVDEMLKNKEVRIIEENRRKLYPILTCIIYCATHDIALRGKTNSSGNVADLIDFRIDAGDQVLEEHIRTAPANAKYTSCRTQNVLINICTKVLRDEIVSAANRSQCFSVLADETTDISGVEQFSLGVRFVGSEGGKVCLREEFLGFVPLSDRSAEGIAEVIEKNCLQFKLNLNKLIGQGYDGCSAMAGKEGGVQAIIQRKYPKAAFVHCSSHRLNLVVNDQNKLSDVRNVVGTIKSVINFFRESNRRREAINIPALCETRWTHKYRSIRMFAESFTQIINQLDILSQSSVKNTREVAYQLLSACRSSSFLVVLVIIKKYSSMLEPIAQALQAVDMDLQKVHSLVNEIVTILHHRRNIVDEGYSDIFQETEQLACDIGSTIAMPRQAGRQTGRSNPPSSSVEEYFRRAIYTPYLDSIISSLECRFAAPNSVPFSLLMLHPLKMLTMDRKQFIKQMKLVEAFYELDNFSEESDLWYELWEKRAQEQARQGKTRQDKQDKTRQEKSSDKDPKGMDLFALATEAQLLPSVHSAITIALTLPSTTCTVERSFSTLRRVKTWLRSSMSDERLSGLHVCMMSVHRSKILRTEKEIIEKVINIFGTEKRRLKFLFSDNENETLSSENDESTK